MKRLLFFTTAAALAMVLRTGTIQAQGFRLAEPVSDFTVQDMHGHPFHYKAHKGHVTVVMFFSTRCPLSNAFNHRRNTIYDDYKKHVKFLVIDPNANESLEEVRTYASQVGFDFPVYKDVNNVVADLFNVWTTTDTFVIDSSGFMRYHGYVEDSPNPERSKKQGLRLAITAVLAGEPVEMAEAKSRGCAVRRVKPGLN